MKVFTKTVKYKVFNVVKNNDTKGYNDLCKAAENYSVLEKIQLMTIICARAKKQFRL